MSMQEFQWLLALPEFAICSAGNLQICHCIVVLKISQKHLKGCDLVTVAMQLTSSAAGLTIVFQDQDAHSTVRCHPLVMSLRMPVSPSHVAGFNASKSIILRLQAIKARH